MESSARALALTVLAVAWGLGTAARTGAGVDRPEYAVATLFPLEASPSGTGRLELLEDARIRPDLRGELRVTSRGIDCTGAGTERLRALCASLPGNPLRPAMLRAVTAGGLELGTHELERPLAELSLVQLHGGPPPAYAVTIDFRDDADPEMGLVTRLAEIQRGRLIWLRAVDVRTRRMDVIRLTAGPRAAWQLSPRPGGAGKDILLVSCSLTTGTSYVRFSLEGRGWRRHERTEPECRETGQPFPARSRFP